MTGFQIYVFVLCLFVFLLLASIFISVVAIIVKMTLKMIRHGLEDDDIIKEKQTSVKPNGVGTILVNVFNCIVAGILCCFFVFSLYVGLTKDKAPNGIPSIKVVKTASMATKNQKNEYLFENDINDQIQAFDLIITHHLPKEEELKLYDIVVYAVDDAYVIHRIVGIEEPNEKHPNERYFLLQGDANDRPDIFPVKYEQMQGVYRGVRIPFVGSFVLFMQSPAGWLCIMLVLGALIATPILEKKIKKEREKRYQIILLAQKNNEVVVNEVVAIVNQEVGEETDVTNVYPERKDFRTFKEKLEDADDLIKERYQKLTDFIARIQGVRAIESKKQISFKKGNSAIARFNFRGKTLCCLLGLAPAEYENTKYIFTDVSSVKEHANYPMRIKLTSDRQTRWTEELLSDLVAKKGLVLLEKPIDIVSEVIDAVNKEVAFTSFAERKDFRTFNEKLEDADDLIKDRYQKLTDFIARIQGVRAIESKKQISFKKGNSAIARFNFRGKTLCCLLGLEPVEYEDSKYIFTDVSDVKAHERYPMRVKLTSNRQTRWTEELLGDLVAKKGCVLLEKPIDIVSEVINAVNQEVAFTSFAERKDFRTFKEKLEDADDLIKDRYQKLTELVSRIKGIRVIESKKQVSFKKGSLSVARFNFRGKTLCCLLGLTPAEYEDSKYIFKDVSNVKAHERYPMRVKLTSNRQTRWTEELLLDLIAKKGLILLEKPRAIKSIFGGLKAEKKSFEEKLNRSNKQVKEWYAQVVDKIKSVAGIREIQSFGFRTFRFGNKPIAKITIKGKTLNVYLALNPKDYIDTKYIYQDASTVKKYANYPMRVKLTSNRKVKWTAELLDDVFSGVKL